MEPNPEVTEAYKQDVLEKNPLFRYYLSDSFTADSNQWNEDVKETFLTPYSQIASVKENGWDEDMLNQMLEQWQNMGVTNLEQDEQQALLGTHILIGYEVGNTQDITLFSDELRKRFRDVGLIAPKFLPPGVKQKAELYLFSVLEFGAHLKLEVQNKMKQQEDFRQNASYFIDYIENELDLKGI